MNKLFIYILLASYAIMIVRPVVPYISDTIAHTFWRYQHISTVHFENGKYHTHYEVLEAAKKTDPEKASHSGKTDTNIGEHFSTSSNYNISLPALSIVSSFPYSPSNICSTYLFFDYPPPKPSLF
jgi:hypothetical protein